VASFALGGWGRWRIGVRALDPAPRFGADEEIEDFVHAVGATAALRLETARHVISGTFVEPGKRLEICARMAVIARPISRESARAATASSAPCGS